MRPPALVLCVALTCASSFAEDAAIRRLELPNGMTVVLAAAPDAARVAVHLTFDAGSRLDPASHPGTAWLASRVLGGRLPGFTADLNQERSLFSTTTTREQLGETLAAIRDALRNTAVTPAELERARKELHDETKAAEAALLSLVYGGLPHGHAAKSDPGNLRRRDVERFLSKHYRPAAAVVALAGTLDGATVLRHVDATLAELPRRGARQRCRPYDVGQSAERSRTLPSAAARQAELHLGYPTAPAPDADWYALNILADVIGQGAESRLQRALAGSGLATDFAEGETESPCTASLLRMRVRVAPGRTVAEVREVLDRELARLTREAVTEQELATAHDQERAWAAEQASTVEGLASAAARAELFYGDATRIRTDVERMSGVSAEDVLRVARKYLQPANRAVVLVCDGHSCPSAAQTGVSVPHLRCVRGILPRARPRFLDSRRAS